MSIYMNSNDIKSERIFPPGGLVIYPNIRYVDGQDIDQKTREEDIEYFYNDEEYKKLAELKNYTDLQDSVVEKRIDAYIYKGDKRLGIIRYVNYDKHPEGYGPKDYRIIKLIYPEFRRTKYSRYASSDLVHMLFHSGVAENCYVYQKIAKEKASDFMAFFSGNEKDAPPCSVPKFGSDGPLVQIYIKIKKIYPTPYDYSVVLYHLDGSLYRSLNLKKYLSAPAYRTDEVVNRWIKEMNEAAEVVRNTWTA